jgi:hypothetical protein
LTFIPVSSTEPVYLYNLWQFKTCFLKFTLFSTPKEYLYVDLAENLIVANSKSSVFTTSAYSNSTKAAEIAFSRRFKSIKKYVEECSVNVVVKYNESFEERYEMNEYLIADHDFGKRKYKYSTIIFVDNKVHLNLITSLITFPVRMFWLLYKYPQEM